MSHWAGRSGENVKRRFGFFQVKKDNFCFYHRQQNQWGLEFDINDLAIFMQSLHISRRKLLGEISTLGKLLLVMPATNAVGERSFSALRRGKTYLSSTTGDSRLYHCIMLHVHMDGTDPPTLRQCKIYNCTGVKLGRLRVYIESLTMSSREPPKKKSRGDNGWIFLFEQRMHMRGCNVFCASMHQFVPYGKTQDL